MPTPRKNPRRRKVDHSVLSVRPKIAELVFQFYGRALHPELFEVHKAKRIERNAYTADIKITSAGHVICWRRDDLILTEVATSGHHPLPQKRRLMSHTLRGVQSDKVECRGGVTYDVDFALETVDEEAFFTYQKEFTLAGAKSGLLHVFDSSGRFGLGALSYVHLESREKSLKVLALHTFPDDYAVVKTKSVFRLPG
ncbi:MAG: DUF2617 family protein [Planctomycetota bacterium]